MASAAKRSSGSNAYDVQIAVRLPSSEVRKLDAVARAMSSKGVRITRASVIRMFVAEGLDGFVAGERREEKKR